jgi:antitoxin (DNA-binding transcriptional repressor) of toxin-antitoxin stability system
MKTATIRDLRYSFKDVEAQLAEGEEIEITRRKRVIARLVPVVAEPKSIFPDFLGRMKENWGNKTLAPSNADLLAEERERF